ncbi:efflux RND transporter periplasmic adaptor subunit, partial [Mitsuaria sp. TWR114]|uniref:efflux RND transporter periplasmic adaptor subunit n=1 Tax=Mitsuaria sp. TWR114 TaxID=2601731 RepID=UPI0021025775
LALGEQVKEDASAFVLSDLRTVWARIDVPAADLAKVRVGARAVVRATAFEQSAPGTVTYVGALIGGQTRTAQARIALSNPDGAWRPGLFVDVDLVTGETSARSPCRRRRCKSSRTGRSSSCGCPRASPRSR